jgi:hypothetical protein
MTRATVDDEDDTSLSFCVSDESSDAVEVVTFRYSYYFRDAASLELFIRELRIGACARARDPPPPAAADAWEPGLAVGEAASPESRLICGNPAAMQIAAARSTRAGSHKWMEYYEDKPTACPRLDAPFVSVLQSQRAHARTDEQAAVARNELAHWLGTWFPDLCPTDTEPIDDDSELLDTLVDCAITHVITQSDVRERYAGDTRQEQVEVAAAEASRLFGDEFALNVSTQACEGLTADNARDSMLADGESTADLDSGSSGSSSEDDMDQFVLDERRGMIQDKKRWTVAEMVETPAAELADRAQCAGWLSKEEKKRGKIHYVKHWCVLTNLEPVGTPDKDTAPTRVMLFYDNERSEEAEEAIYLRDEKYQVRPPKTQRKKAEFCFRISTWDEHLAQMSEAADQAEAEARGEKRGRRSSIDMRMEMQATKRGSKVTERRGSVSFGPQDNRVKRTLTTKKAEGKYILAAENDENLQRWKGALMDHWLAKHQPKTSVVAAGSTDDEHVEPEMELEPEPELQSWKALR